MNESVKKRLLASIKLSEDGCWEWQKALRVGYGAIKVDGKVVSAHRLSYLIFNGKIDNNLFVCHKCDNRKCINPDHLFLGTQSENMKDCSAKGRIARNNGNRFKKGEESPTSLLNKADRLIIWNLIKSRGNTTLKQMSIELNVPYQMLKDMRRKRLRVAFE